MVVINKTSVGFWKALWLKSIYMRIQYAGSAEKRGKVIWNGGTFQFFIIIDGLYSKKTGYKTEVQNTHCIQARDSLGAV